MGLHWGLWEWWEWRAPHPTVLVGQAPDLRMEKYCKKQRDSGCMTGLECWLLPVKKRWEVLGSCHLISGADSSVVSPRSPPVSQGFDHGNETKQYAATCECACPPPPRKKNFVSRLSSELQSILWLDFSVGCVSHVSFKGGLGHPTSISLSFFNPFPPLPCSFSWPQEAPDRICLWQAGDAQWVVHASMRHP